MVLSGAVNHSWAEPTPRDVLTGRRAYTRVNAATQDEEHVFNDPHHASYFHSIRNKKSHQVTSDCFSGAVVGVLEASCHRVEQMWTDYISRTCTLCIVRHGQVWDFIFLEYWSEESQVTCGRRAASCKHLYEMFLTCFDDSPSPWLDCCSDSLLLRNDRSILQQQLDFILVAFCRFVLDKFK